MLFDRRQQALAQRCDDLQARSAGLRLALADRALAGLRWLKAHPQWVGIGVAVLVVWRPRRVLRLGARLWGAWQLWGRVQRWQAAAGPLLPRRR